MEEQGELDTGLLKLCWYLGRVSGASGVGVWSKACYHQVCCSFGSSEELCRSVVKPGEMGTCVILPFNPQPMVCNSTISPPLGPNVNVH